MPLPLNTLPTASFDEPFDLLHACHARVERSLVLLLRLGDYLSEQGGQDPDGLARDAATDVLRYFDVAAPLHHADEEQHVFPALRQAGQPELAALADVLQEEHRQMDAQWRPIRADLQTLQNEQMPDAQMLQAARQRWVAFAALYRKHLATEESLAYPPCIQRLNPADQQAMGREMAGRRGARYPEDRR